MWTRDWEACGIERQDQSNPQGGYCISQPLKNTQGGICPGINKKARATTIFFLELIELNY